MATIDYKEKYEQALERARQFMETPYLENSDDVVGFIFPELKESEGERIRKGIESIIKHYRDEGEVVCPYPFVTLEEALAWLEKQAEQKSAWSEEDEEQLSFCCAAIELSNYSSDEYRNYAISFLESLKDRVQPKCAEWSEEDKKKLNRIYMLLAEAADEHAFSTTCRLIGDKECVDLQDFLNSLRYKNTWKPSDKQMEQLHKYCPDNKPLTVLYEQLKKLKL